MRRASLLILLVIIAASVILSASAVPAGRQEGPPRPSYENVVLFPSGARITVEIADDVFEQARGLAGRESLAQNEGLLFLHGQSAVQHYWMKGMLISIDIIWIDGDRVAGFVQNAKPQKPPWTIYASPSPVDKVLEVYAGFVADHRVNIGDTLDIELADE